MFQCFTLLTEFNVLLIRLNQTGPNPALCCSIFFEFDFTITEKPIRITMNNACPSVQSKRWTTNEKVFCICNRPKNISYSYCNNKSSYTHTHTHIHCQISEYNKWMNLKSFFNTHINFCIEVCVVFFTFRMSVMRRVLYDVLSETWTHFLVHFTVYKVKC